MTTERAFRLAVQHKQSGRLAEAEALCRQILSVQPHHADVLHLLGVIAHDVNRNDVAVNLIQRAIALAPNAWEFHCSLGEAYRQLGCLDEAIGAYRRVLQFKPSYAEVHNNLGASLRTQGHLNEAIAEYRTAVHLKPEYAEAHLNLGDALRDQGRLEESAIAYRRAAELRPDFAEVHFKLGNALQNQGGIKEAIAAYYRAIELRPSYAEAHCDLGNALRDHGRLDEALAAYRRAIHLQPDLAGVHNNLGNALRDQGHIDEAIAAYQRALELQPAYAEAHCNLGIILRDHGRLEEALAAHRRALELQPDLAEAHCDLGNTLLDQGYFDEAVAAFHQALQLQPNLAEAHSNLGNALRSQGGLDEALAAHRRALQLDPDDVGFKWNTSLVLLLQGDFEHGGPLFENRWELNDLKRAKRNFPQPMWRGEALHGRRILLHAEQGFGDTLQFIRYAPLVAARGGHVIVECQPALKSLLTTVEGIAEIIGFGEPIPTFELQCPLMSLPLALGTRLETIPATIPYLQADGAKTAQWQKKLESVLSGSSVLSVPSQPDPLKVGLVWAGGERHHQPKLRPLDLRRSMRLHQFASLAKVPGIVFVSLQKGAPVTQAKAPPEGMTLLDWTDELNDFADTAALIETLDLVISVDTAVAHLAGALGKPVWLLNRFDTCWRWMLHRTDSPWYPTLRLFRQPKAGDWESVLADICDQLQTLTQGRRTLDQDH